MRNLTVVLKMVLILSSCRYLAKGFSSKLNGRWNFPSSKGQVHAESRRYSTSLSDIDVKSEKDIVDAMLYRIRECNRVPKEVKSSLLDFVVEGQTVGKVTKKVAKLLCDSTPSSKKVFEYIEDSRILTLSTDVDNTVESRTKAVMSIMENLRSQGIIKGWRDELLPLSKGFYDDPVLLVERAAAPFLGMQQYGVHINGIIKDEDERMWMARRSATKSKYPGMLDHIVAGGQPAGLGLMENVIKECEEEAGIPEDLTRRGIKAGGAISYEVFEAGESSDIVDGTISRSTLFCYDLELPTDFVPVAMDGEVDNFFVWGLDEVKSSMTKDYHDPLKPNCYPVIIDFLLRKGYISPEVPGYLDILSELRGGYCG